MTTIRAPDHGLLRGSGHRRVWWTDRMTAIVIAGADRFTADAANIA